MGWLIALAVLVLLAVLPLGGYVRYDDSGVLVKIVAGPVKFTVYPMKKKEKKPKKVKTTEKSAEAGAQTVPPAQSAGPDLSDLEPVPEEPPEKKGGSLTDFLPLVKVALDLLGDFRRKLRVNLLEVKLILAGDDPADLAISYGRAWTAVGNLMPRLERFLVIKKRDVQVECDFTASQTKIYAALELTITLGRLVALAAVYGFRAVRELLKINKKRKGGTVT